MTPRFREAWAVRERHFGPQVVFDHLQETVAVSVTGAACSLSCKHCDSHFLGAMTPIERVPAAPSYLISGGCDREGKVPLLLRTQEIAALSGRKNLHVGLVAEEEASAYAALGEVVSLDFVGDDATIREVYGLDKRVEDYLAAYRLLRRHARVIPHITLGLLGGTWSGERRALELLAGEGVEAITFLVFFPVPGTAYGDRAPLPVEEVLQFLAEARMLLPEVPLALGCMRPRGRYRQILDEGRCRRG